MSYRKYLALLLLAFCCRAHAFESWEHRQLSILAYALAVDIYCSQFNDEAVKSTCAELPLQGRGEWNGKTWVRGSAITYGDIAMCVDFFLSPDKLIAGRETSLISKAGSPPRTSLYPKNDNELELDHLYRCKDKLLNYEGMRAMHVNHMHFQAELLVAQRNNHLLALSARTIEQNLYTAVLFSAISDHFLQDSFAPGHITSWRNRLTDLAANAYHDKHNRGGWTVSIEAEKLKDFLMMRHKNIALTAIAGLVSARMQDSAAPWYRHAFLIPQRSADDEPCRGTCRATISDADMGTLARLANEFGDRPESPAARTFIEVELRGDSFLWSKEHDKQRFLMLLVQIRSIMDVLQSGSTKITDAEGGMRVHVVDSFAGNAWNWRWTDKPADSYFAISDSVLDMTLGPIPFSLPHRSDADPRADEKVVRYRDMDPIVGVGVGAENMVFGDAQTRYNVTLETVVYGLAKEDRNRNWAVTAGIQPYYSRDFSGLSLYSRVVFLRPEIEMAYSIPFRMVHLQQLNGRSTWRPSLGARIDAGFTSFLMFYVQVNWDSAAQRDGRIRSGPSLGAGIQFAAPKCRALIVKSLSDCGIPAGSPGGRR